MNNNSLCNLDLIFCVSCITLQTQTELVRTSQTNNFNDVVEAPCHCDRIQVRMLNCDSLVFTRVNMSYNGL